MMIQLQLGMWQKIWLLKRSISLKKVIDYLQPIFIFFYVEPCIDFFMNWEKLKKLN